MSEKQKNALATVAMLSVLFVGATGIGYLLTEIESGNFNHGGTKVEVVHTQPQMPRTFSWEERYAVCALYQLDCSATALTVEDSVIEQIQSYTIAELEGVYPLPEWQVTEQGETVTITHYVEGLCKKHRTIYHLGSSENGQFVAVYYGPSEVGNAAGVFLVTDVPLDRLSPERLTALYGGQYEYRSQDDLIAILDNFSEL